MYDLLNISIFLSSKNSCAHYDGVAAYELHDTVLLKKFYFQILRISDEKWRRAPSVIEMKKNSSTI